MIKKKRKKKQVKSDGTMFLGEEEYRKIYNLDDSSLAGMIIKNIPGAYREMEKRYAKKLFAYIYHLTGNRDEAKDILQNVFVKMYKNLKSFDRDRKFSSWIYRIAHNESVNFLKRRSRKQFVSWEDVVSSKDKLESSSQDDSPAESWEKKEIKKEVRDALNKLPAKYKEVLILRYFMDKSYEEMGEILEKPVNTVGTLINRAKKKLLEVIKEG